MLRIDDCLKFRGLLGPSERVIRGGAIQKSFAVIAGLNTSVRLYRHGRKNWESVRQRYISVAWCDSCLTNSSNHQNSTASSMAFDIA